MIPGALAQLTTVFNRRFLFNALLPTLVFATVLAPWSWLTSTPSPSWARGGRGLMC
jgi:hypothetical protein